MTEAGLDFDEIRIPLDTPTYKAEILKHSPVGTVPILKHDGLVIPESLAICEYVAEQFAPQLWPADGEERAIARAVSAEMHAGFLPLRTHMPMNCRDRQPGKGHFPDVLQNIARIQAMWRDCRSRYGSGGAFLFGEFSIADAMYAPVVSRFVTYGVEMDRVCQAYADAIWSLAGMRAWLAAAEQEAEVIEL